MPRREYETGKHRLLADRLLLHLELFESLEGRTLPGAELSLHLSSVTPVDVALGHYRLQHVFESFEGRTLPGGGLSLHLSKNAVTPVDVALGHYTINVDEVCLEEAYSSPSIMIRMWFRYSDFVNLSAEVINTWDRWPRATLFHGDDLSVQFSCLVWAHASDVYASYFSDTDHGNTIERVSDLSWLDDVGDLYGSETAGNTNEDPTAAGLLSSVNWTPEKNIRRYELIEKEVAGLITPAEQLELDRLQVEVDDYVSQTAPRPISELEEIKQLLLATISNS